MTVSDLTRQFGNFGAVDRVGFSVRRGEAFGLIGSNGAGKSTIIRMLTTLLPVTSARERFMGIGQVVTMPICFASNAIYPLEIMPAWLRAVARLNPLTYKVDALRALMLRGGSSVFGLGTDFAALAGVFAVLVAAAAHLYGRMGN